MRRLRNPLPTTVTRAVRGWAIATWIAQVLIVVTGGAVRLTASGLGCPTWPTCTEDSLVSTPEMGIHGLIEFGNRLLTFVLVVIAIGMFLAVVRLRRTRRDLFWLALAIGLGVPLQAIIGGISVWMQLNPYVVGLHFVVSGVMIALATVLVVRTRPRRSSTAPVGLSVIAWLAFGLQTVTVLVGILVTGSGPHAGDSDAPRNGLNSEILQHIHSYPAYAALATIVLFVIVAWRTGHPDFVRAGFIIVAINIAQIVVGIAQSRLGLPVLLVGAHMFLACLVITGVSYLVAKLRWQGRS